MNETIVLFDIDGTLLRGGNRIHGRAMMQAIKDSTGMDVAIHAGAMDSGGRTDRWIVAELLRRAGMAQADIDAAFPDIAKRAIDIARLSFTEPDSGWVLPGAKQLLRALEGDQIRFGLVTGNVFEIAKTKLTTAGIFDSFERQSPLLGAFGELSEDRNHLAAAAAEQAGKLLGPAFDSRHIWVVGDTPRDVICAHSIGARCLGVTTGKFTAADLSHHNCDLIVDSLEEVSPSTFR